VRHDRDADDLPLRVEAHGVAFWRLVEVHGELRIVGGEVEHVGVGVVADAVEVDVRDADSHGNDLRAKAVMIVPRPALNATTTLR
jgi:hypothetical protein